MAKNRWWPKSLPLQYQTVLNIKHKIEGHAAALGLEPGEVAEILALCAAFLGAYDFRESTAMTDKSVTDWRDEVYYGDPEGDPVTPAPIFMVLGAVLFTRGTVAQLFKKRDWLLTLPGCTPTIAEDLGLVGTEITPPDPGTWQPAVHAFPAQLGYEYTVVAENRGKSDQWELSIAPVGTMDWTIVGTYTSKSKDIIYAPPPGTDGPVQIQIRIRLLKNDEYFGLLSDVITITLNP